MLFEFHMIKNFPPTNLNRDDTGSPKSCFFGGVQRARISSQCLKRSWRQSPVFKAAVDQLGIRTRKLPDLVSEELRKRGIDEEYVQAAALKVTGFGNRKGTENKDGITAQIMFFSREDILAVAERVEQAIREAGSLDKFQKMNVKDWQKKMENVMTRPITLDMALFGRMVTSDAFADVEAAMQVAHAISTHSVNQESDFYTAVDDLVSGASDDDAGAGMMGDTDFNASCYYMYAALDMDQLGQNLRHSPDVLADAGKVVSCLLEAMAFTNPSGKQNSFAGHVLPDLLYVEVKERKIPVNYANAFVEPARPSGERDLVAESAHRLAREIESVDRDFGMEANKRLWFCRKHGVKAPASATVVGSFRELLTEFAGV
ncbi:MAG: type I-E CRISPR-associated protein Cas7/Cse4/CasC [Bacillota bacterium]|jgi:CRISPR system Cascade subunit CasC